MRFQRLNKQGFSGYEPAANWKTSPKVSESETEATPAEGARRDLDALRTRLEAEDTVVHVAGLTQDNAALHQYVALLGESRLFTKAELSSIETLDPLEYDGTAQFNVQLVLAAGFGLKGGPTEAMKEDDTQLNDTGQTNHES